ncbi:unnamed protein product [Soboliphyme baturini]|uniref:CIA30 domain-containing protein n=1 Tax=Soboliphyme baturini TaxID=241478 RepID=A0A183II58_9BILA|nr:unnamed protein product [Soboliphyme baturini]
MKTRITRGGLDARQPIGLRTGVLEIGKTPSWEWMSEVMRSLVWSSRPARTGLDDFGGSGQLEFRLPPTNTTTLTVSGARAPFPGRMMGKDGIGGKKCRPFTFSRDGIG